MASIVKRPDGHRWIQFVDASEKRQTIRLGRATQKTAETVCARVEQLLSAKMTGNALDRDLSAWLSSIDATLQNKLAAVGLCPSRAASNLGPFIAEYVAGRTDVKPATKVIWKQGERSLLEYFGESKQLRDISAGDADNYKLFLMGTKLAPMTVRKRLQFATMVFRAAVRRRLILESPFADVSIQASMPDRSHFITPQDTAKLLEACPDHHWRLIVALARFGGLRCPSEVLSLRWQDVDWSAKRINVRSPKTEHHVGKESRTIPLFPELLEHLETSFALAPVGAVHVIDDKLVSRQKIETGWRNCNLRTTFEKIVQRAGLKPWPRLFHNLRSSRQTELAEQFPSHVVCEWLGNSEEVARKHYFQTTEDHFAKATNEPETSPEQAKHNPKQYTTVYTSTESHRKNEKCDIPRENESLLLGATYPADGEGFEPPVAFRLRQFSRLLP